MTLRTRIYFLVALALGPALALFVFDHYRGIRTRVADAEQQALQSALLVSAEVDQLLKGFENLIRVTGHAPMVKALRQPECDGFLLHVQKTIPGIAWLRIVDRDGNIRCGSGVASLPLSKTFLEAMLASEELAVGNYLASGGQPQSAVLPLGIRIETREETSFLIAALGLDWLRAHFASRFAALPKNSSLTLVDRDGTIVLRLPNFDREGKPLRNYEYVVNAPQPGSFRSIAELNADGIARFLGFTPLSAPPRGLAIAVGLPQEAQLSAVRSAAIRNYFSMGLVALLAFIAAATAGHALINRPTHDLLGAIDRWRKGDLSARATAPSTTLEFEQLRTAFNAMADDLTVALKHKDMLLKELSHRVINSLQMISAMFRLQARSEQEPLRTRLDKASGRVDAVALTYKRMQTVGGVDTIDFSAFLRELCNNLSSALLRTRCLVEADQVGLEPEKALPLSIIVNELVTNASKYGVNSDEPIRVKLSREGDACRLTVRNAGTLRADYGKSDGFGISMIRFLVMQLRGTLDIASNDGIVTFAVCFPLSPRPGLSKE